MKWCELFKAGTHTDHSGNKITITTADIDKIIKNFNEKNPDVPLVIGHPKVNSPAYGWVDKLKRDGKTLLATFKDVSSEFAEWVNKGFYKTRSISLYEDNTLRHVGWLGAQPPAIKGLASYQFAEDEDVKIFDFSEADTYKFQTVAVILSDLRDFLIEKYGVEIADKVIKNWRIDDLKHIDNQDKEEIAAFCEAIGNPPDKEQQMTGNTEQTGNTPQPTAAAESEIPASVQKTIEAKDNEINELKAQLETEQAEKRKSEYTQFAEQLIKDGKLAPSQKSVVVDLMEVCGRAGSYDFAEGDEKSVLNRFKMFLNNSKHVEFAEIANAGNTGTIQRNVIDFSDGASIAKAIEQKRTEYEKQGIEKSEAQILNELKKGQQN